MIALPLPLSIIVIIIITIIIKIRHASYKDLPAAMLKFQIFLYTTLLPIFQKKLLLFTSVSNSVETCPLDIESEGCMDRSKRP
jgi:hypothetical protein